MRRSLTVIGIGLVLGVSGGIGVATTSDSPAAPTTAPAARVVPSSGQDLDSIIAALQDTLRRVPEDHVSWSNIAVAYVEKARVTEDPTYYQKADEAVGRSFAIEPDENFLALGARAAIAAARHDFPPALADAQAALAINPRDLGALAIQIDALTELGRYEEQLRAVRTADRLQPSTAIATRYAYAYELRGDLDRAADALRRAADSGSRADKAYALTLRANILRRQGRLEESAEDLALARLAVPDHLPITVSMARLKIARGNLEGAVAAWEQVVERQPLPEYLTELGELLLHLGRTEEAVEQFEAVSTTIELTDASGVNSDLEIALFDADHGSPQRAVTAGRAEWERRTSVHVANALAWALHRAGRDAEALPLARASTRLGTQEGRFWIDRGTIEAALGMTSAARAHLERGIAMDPGMSPWKREEAVAALASLDKER